MEPQWNPSLEEQALARVHRIGQTKEVTTVRFIMEDTIETVSLISHQCLILEDAKKGLVRLGSGSTRQERPCVSLTFVIQHVISCIEGATTGEHAI